MVEQPPAGLPPVRLPGGRVVPESALAERSDASGGPGGQHANRTASRVELRLRLAEAGLHDWELALLRERLASRITRDGELVVSVAASRQQLVNRETARERMQALLAEGIHRDPPRRKTRVPRSVVRRLQETKQRHSARKSERRWKPGGDD